MAKISGGANSFLLKALLQAIVDTNAIPGEKIEPLTRRFTERVNETDIAKRQPTEVLRHVGDVLGWLYPLGVKQEAPSSNKDAEYMKGSAPVGVTRKDAPPPSDPKLDLTLDPAEIDLMLDDVSAAEPPSARSGVQAVLDEVADRFAAKPRHPFIESVTHDGKRYIVVGTATIRSSIKEGVSRSANCTAKNYRRIKDADEDILVHIDGRPVCATRELPNDTGVCFVWLLHHTPGLQVRFWLNVTDNGQRRDDPKGSYRITMIDGPVGWKKAS